MGVKLRDLLFDPDLGTNLRLRFPSRARVVRYAEMIDKSGELKRADSPELVLDNLACLIVTRPQEQEQRENEASFGQTYYECQFAGQHREIYDTLIDETGRKWIYAIIIDGETEYNIVSVIHVSSGGLTSLTLERAA